MSELTSMNRDELQPLQPVEPRIDFTIRTATLDDFEWIDAMQKAESDKLGFLMKMAIEKRIEQGNVLVAVATRSEQGIVNNQQERQDSGSTVNGLLFPPHSAEGGPLGYCIAIDRYMKQDHVGQFVQLNVPPAFRRSLVGAALVKATFEKAAYGVKLYGLWCRQDLKANYFWQSLGFVPLAFRASGQSNRPQNSKKPWDPRKQVHIYWQRRVREGDTETAHWFPFETSGGMMAESRVVLPIPLDEGWEEAKPVVLPGAERRAQEVLLLEADQDAKAEADQAALAAKRKEARQAAKEAKRLADGPKRVHGVEISGGGAGVPMGFDLPPEAKAQQVAEQKAAAAAAKKERIKQEKREAKKAAKRARRKTDPEMLAFSRELRDRWQEAVAAGTPGAGLLLERQAGKYDVGRLPAPERANGGEAMLGEANGSNTVPEARRLEVRRRDAA